MASYLCELVLHRSKSDLLTVDDLLKLFAQATGTIEATDKLLLS